MARRSSAPPFEERTFRTQALFARWLARAHASSPGLWLHLAKKGTAVKSITYAEAVETALCWGWIDGQVRRVDEVFYAQRFTPRRPRIVWSKINCARAEALVAAGKMQPPGLAAVERARADGRWARAYDPPSRATIPDDLARAFARNPRAAAFFARLDAVNRFAVLYRLQTASPATRPRRLKAFVATLARGETLIP